MPLTSNGAIQRVYWDRGRPARPRGMPLTSNGAIQRVYWDRGRPARLAECPSITADDLTLLEVDVFTRVIVESFPFHTVVFNEAGGTPAVPVVRCVVSGIRWLGSTEFLNAATICLEQLSSSVKSISDFFSTFHFLPPPRKIVRPLLWFFERRKLRDPFQAL
jgi:hypothetical protein